jgi:hypothetical protein
MSLTLYRADDDVGLHAADGYAAFRAALERIGSGANVERYRSDWLWEPAWYAARAVALTECFDPIFGGLLVDPADPLFRFLPAPMVRAQASCDFGQLSEVDALSAADLREAGATFDRVFDSDVVSRCAAVLLELREFVSAAASRGQSMASVVS